jgi:hypothetical protein
VPAQHKKAVLWKRRFLGFARDKQSQRDANKGRDLQRIERPLHAPKTISRFFRRIAPAMTEVAHFKPVQVANQSMTF